ncbi:VMAP-C domain-containing protein [Thermomonospora cellulosilytica]|uniref:Uncharacterized protein n=1 Tax=Thermomonospora cellulosilytica TaxID=1411118 RepID=A0A7W3R991_9ACTN|nr:hypothetical protein [Thermomonospora cellulosilytica]MBA9004379.1 hypothetical protein [Thermomonospora cellulosilytica]
MVRSLGVEDQLRLVKAFYRLDCMRDRQDRDHCIRLLEKKLGYPLPVLRHPRDLYDVWHLVDTCLAYPGAVRRLAEVVEVFHQGSVPMQELNELIGEFFPEPLLLAEERERLHTLTAGLSERITGVDSAAVHALYRRAVGPVGPALPGGSGHVRQALDQLEDLTTDQNGIPPLLSFVEELAAVAGEPAARRLRAWAAKVAERLGVDRQDVPRALPPAARRGRSERSRAYLVIKFQLDALRADRYRPTAWLQHEGEPGAMLRCDEDPLPLTGLPRLVEELLTEDHQVVNRAAVDLTVEFFLPRRLLHYPLDEIRITIGGLERRLGIEHPVVVRSLDRLEHRALHHNWRRKWTRLVGDPADVAVCLVSRPGEVTGEAFYNRLLSDDSALCVALSFPPRSDAAAGADEMWAGVQAGTPIVAWPRSPRDPARFAAEIQELVDQGAMYLPETVLALRRSALREQTTGAADDDHLGFHLTLLFDDADRIPEPRGRLGAPA